MTSGAGGQLARALAQAVLWAALTWLSIPVVLHWARPALLNLGPNDDAYVGGFRDGWERDGATRFRWSSTKAFIRLPLYVKGSDLKLSLRLRRHFPEPAHVTLRVEDRPVARFDIDARGPLPYRVLEFCLSDLAGSAPFRLDIDAASENPRPLGVAIDWIEVARTGPSAGFRVRAATRFALALVVAVAFLAPRLLGGAGWIAPLHAGAMAAGGLLGVAWDVVAAERILRLGTPFYVAFAALAWLLSRSSRIRAALGAAAPATTGLVTTLALLGLAVRLLLVLHPQFYYPDVKIHALFAWGLVREGPSRFLREFTANQFRYSLGLQFENGHWYAFPYPPGFYVMCWPLIRFFSYRAEVAVSALGAALNAVDVLLVFAIAERLTRSRRAATFAAGSVVLLPIFTTRLTLAYYPDLAGHFFDTLLMLTLLGLLDQLHRPRVFLSLAALLAVALLTYTQSLLNWGLFLPLLLVADLVGDRSPAGRRRQFGLVTLGVLGLVFSFAAFYGRYIPTFLDMRRGIPMPEEAILSELTERRAAIAAMTGQEDVQEDVDDPYSGPGIDLWRGFKKACWRAYIFYSGFVPLVVAGLLLLARGADATTRRFVLAWGLTYLLLNLASGGLPSPNLFRYNKDMEIAAPLFCVSLGVVADRLWRSGRPARWAAATLCTVFVAFGAERAARSLASTFAFTR